MKSFFLPRYSSPERIIFSTFVTSKLWIILKAIGGGLLGCSVSIWTGLPRFQSMARYSLGAFCLSCLFYRKNWNQ
jgi:hypothetical protein